MKHFLTVRVFDYVLSKQVFLEQKERFSVPKQSCMEFWKLTTSVAFLIQRSLFLSSSFTHLADCLPLCLHFIQYFSFSSFSILWLMPSFCLISIELGFPDNSWHGSICYHVYLLLLRLPLPSLTLSQWWQSWCFRGGICCWGFPSHDTVLYKHF